MKTITDEMMLRFENYLMEEEKSNATISRYMHDVHQFATWITTNSIEKSLVLQYKAYLCGIYAPASVNVTISSLNCFFAFCGWPELKVKSLKIQRRIFSSLDKELTKAEYGRLLMAAKTKKDERLYLLMQTICSTGIRVSELKFITVDAVRSGIALINCKGKRRQVFLPKDLRKMLSRYLYEQNIKSGSVFVTKNGNPLDRSNIWSDMKKLCKAAKVSEKKVFPHNFRHLFARTFYSLQKDVVRLADILGHSSVNTTRIYTMETGSVHQRQIEKLGLLLNCGKT